MRLRRLIWPDTVLGQMIAIVLGAVIVVSIGGNTAQELVRRDRAGIVGTGDQLQRVAGIAQILRGAGPEDRATVLELSRAGGMDLVLLPAAELESRSAPPDLPGRVGGMLDGLFGAEAPARETWLDGNPVLVVRVDPETELVSLSSLPRHVVSTELIYYLLAVGTLVIGFSAFAVRGISAPIRRMARALDSTDRFLADDTPLEAGPRREGAREFRRLAAALSEMRARIRAMLESRTRMLRSISHDLRTPLTRLRLRIERSGDPALQAQALSDIARIDAMIETTLRYLRDGTGSTTREPCDLPSLLQTICDDFADMGSDIAYSGPAHLTANCSVTDITRAVTNLCENALKFGTVARVTLRRTDAMAEIAVVDDGPGIPAAMRERVLEPYFKLDESRSERGFGLGLSIAAEIAAGHGGGLSLSDNSPHGLVATLALPLGGDGA